MSINSSINVANPKQSIESAFKMMHYVVPAFQREYVWEKDEIEQLLNDIEEAFRSDKNKEYFLGTTVVFEDDEKKQLIDGQQRMTTFFLILCAIAKTYKRHNTDSSTFENLINTPILNADGEPINSYTLELQYETATNCLANIWEENIPEENDDLPASSRRLYDAFSIVSTQLEKDFSDFSEYKQFASYFLYKVTFIQIGATNISDALKIFETINQRGKGLNPMDLLKNMLFMHIDEGKFEKLSDKWKTLMDTLEGMGEKPLRFLRYYLTATYDISDVKPDFQGIIKEDDIYKWLSNNNDKCHYEEDPEQFTNDMIAGLEYYKLLLNPDLSVIGRDYLVGIINLMGKSYRLHLVPLLSASSLPSDLKEYLYKIFETVIYYSVVNDIKSNTMEKLLSSWCPSLREVTNREELERFISDKVVPTLTNWNKLYRQNFMGLSLNSLTKYKIKTILARITRFIDASRANDSNVTDVHSYLRSAIDVEHIMPQKTNDMMQYDCFSQDEYDYHKQRLGNLTLLEKTINTSIQTDSFSDKCLAYENSAFYLTKSIGGLKDLGSNTAINRINVLLKDWDAWNPDSIEERQEVLYELSKLVWPLPQAGLE